jgi:hypothetical protein
MSDAAAVSSTLMLLRCSPLQFLRVEAMGRFRRIVGRYELRAPPAICRAESGLRSHSLHRPLAGRHQSSRDTRRRPPRWLHSLRRHLQCSAPGRLVRTAAAGEAGGSDRAIDCGRGSGTEARNCQTGASLCARTGTCVGRQVVAGATIATRTAPSRLLRRRTQRRLGSAQPSRGEGLPGACQRHPAER